MVKFILPILLIGILIHSQADAKRIPAPKVEPVVLNGVCYVAPNDNGRRAYVEAWDVQTGKKLWEVTVFSNVIKPSLEEDVQWIYIKKLSLNEGSLMVESELGRTYSVDLKTRRVREILREKQKGATNNSVEPAPTR